ncbi:glycosyltransferase [Fulvivirga ligni]|uniref:glycosyltransferase n=1 Tax=Fulvivirga ligni TaxID=2904246 RepID=UPI001F1C1EA4|nr:glycosyltransferase family 2 protein [Fulvivirga ligni]UII24220.1 glycosyltransferase family 2 protein [Fulvivirga ligni]
MKNLYLERYAFSEALINDAPDHNLDAIVTIPCYKEEDLISSLQALKNCDREGLSIEVIIVINQSEDADESVNEINTKAFDNALEWSLANDESGFKVYPFFKNDLPRKHAGVGLARKIAMDEAVRRFESISKPEGIIICYDADSSCDKNYLQEVVGFFNNHPKCPGASIYFEHPLEGPYSDQIYQAIIDYELFLRYYVNALRYAGFPYAFETIGSSMAVRSNAYQKQGGMNKRKAGEDFYFLHKIIPMGHFGEINSTKVMPSPRQSDRVPFGTGKAVNDWLREGQLLTYDVQIFDELKQFLDIVPKLYSEPLITPLIATMPASISSFLADNNFEEELDRIKKHSKTYDTFIKQFYHWFDGFKVLKYVHYARDHHYPNLPVNDCSKLLLNQLGKQLKGDENNRMLLEMIREIDRKFS